MFMQKKSGVLHRMRLTLCLLVCAMMLVATGSAAGQRSQSAPVVLTPSAPGTTSYQGGSALIDASNASEGYIMVKYSGSAKKVKLQIIYAGVSPYQYTLHSGVMDVFPLTEGNGSYTINVYEQVTGDQYALALGKTISVKLRSSLLPYLYPNQYVNFSTGSKAVAKGGELAKGLPDDLAVVGAVYDYVISNVVYDDAKVNSVRSGYVPNVDETLASGKGICFDYAALMATMLRTQNIPTRLDVGYAGNAYHAWVSVYLADQGWVNGIIRFDGKNWTLMDPTFASGGNSKYVGDGTNYSIKYKY